MKIKDSRFGIMGLARSGVAAARKILEYDGSLFISECKPEDEIRKEITMNYGNQVWQLLSPHSEFGGHTDRIFDCDVLIVSPGITKENRFIKKALEKNIKVISEIEFGFLIKDASSKIIAVTGSNGKSTTVSLIDHILKDAGFSTALAGNIGNSFTSFPIEKPGFDYIILEISSFQLELIEKFKPETALFLNLSSDHLDRHHTIEEYLDIKMRIFLNQKSDNIAVLNIEDNSIRSRESRIKAKKFYFARNKEALPHNAEYCTYLEKNQIVLTNQVGRETDRKRINTQDIALIGEHNRLNIMASVLAVINEIEDISIIEKSLKSFLPLPHRLEKVAIKNGIEFYNDSKATNTESVIHALTAFNKPLHLIAGGYEKGEDYSVLVPYLKESVKRIYLIGNAKRNMEKAFSTLKNRVFSYESLAGAVNAAYQEAAPGEVVLLSPACASYDMFKNYEHRGDAFRDAVQNLEKK